MIRNACLNLLFFVYLYLVQVYIFKLQFISYGLIMINIIMSGPFAGLHTNIYNPLPHVSTLTLSTETIINPWKTVSESNPSVHHWDDEHIYYVSSNKLSGDDSSACYMQDKSYIDMTRCLLRP